MNFPEHPIDTPRLDVIRKFLRSNTGLNLGCGRTRFPFKINVDVKTEHSNTDIIADARDLSMFKDGSMDEVVFADVIEHILEKDVGVALKEIRRVLKKGGRLFLSTPNDTWLCKILDPVWWMSGHRHYCNQEINRLLLSAGFKEVVAFTCGKIPFGVVTLAYAVNWAFRRKTAYLFGDVVRKAYNGAIGNKGGTLYAIATK